MFLDFFQHLAESVAPEEFSTNGNLNEYKGDFTWA